MVTVKIRRRELVLINVFGLCLCLLMAILFAVTNERIKRSMREVEVTDKLVESYSHPQNKQALKTLLYACESQKTLIRQGVDGGIYIFLFITVIWCVSLIMVMKFGDGVTSTR